MKIDGKSWNDTSPKFKVNNLQDQTIKMKRAKNIFNTGRSAKLDYEMLINSISDNKYKNNAT